LMAPADVPQIMAKGFAAPRGIMVAMARSTPTWYAALAPPPVMINPTGRFDLAGNALTIAFLVRSAENESTCAEELGKAIARRCRVLLSSPLDMERRGTRVEF